jgi:membrane-associated phospholipid phosphatase
MSPTAPTASRDRRAWIWTTVVALLGLVILVFVLNWLGHEQLVDESDDHDVFIHTWVVRNRADWPRLTFVFRTATLFGNPLLAALATVLGAIALHGLYRLGVPGVRRCDAAIWLVAIIGSRLLSLALKEIYQRSRPPVVDRLVPENSYSFPSAHSVFAAVFFTMVAVTIFRLIPRGRWALRTAAVSACVVLAVLVGMSRVWLGVHYPTDVIAGLVIGFCWASAVVLATRG